MVGAGGVGDAAARSPSNGLLRAASSSPTTTSTRPSARWRLVRAQPGDIRFRAGSVDASDAGAVEVWRARWVPRTSSTPSTLASSCRSSTGAAPPVLTTSTWRCPVEPSPRPQPYEPRPASSSATSSSPRPSEWEADGRLALVGIGVEPGLSDVFARYAADHLFSPHRRARHPRRCQPRHPRRGRQRGLRPGLLDVDDHRGVPQPAGGVGEGPSGGLRTAATTSRPDSSPCRRSASPRSSTSPRASARWSACTSSTRRCSSCRAGSTPSG
jgi:hypothetical protein